MNEDLSGYHLLKERLQKSIPLIEDMLKNPPQKKKFPQTPVFYTCGVGSSESHARFFNYLVNAYTRAKSVFVPLSRYVSPLDRPFHKATLVVISQGISPNTLLALKEHHRFEHTILFTATKLDTPSKKAFSQKAAILKELIEAKATIVTFPIENEYELLIRVIGPLCAYLAILQFVSVHLQPNLPFCSTDKLIKSLEASYQKTFDVTCGQKAFSLEQGSYILASNPLCEFSQNLCYKVLEGLFLPLPHLCDVISFAHGPFQQLTLKPYPVFFLDQGTPTDHFLFHKTEPLFQAAKVPYWRIFSHLPTPWSILEFEVIFNAFILKNFHHYCPNQKNWPGKNLDASLYNLSDPVPLKFRVKE